MHSFPCGYHAPWASFISLMNVITGLILKVFLLFIYVLYTSFKGERKRRENIDAVNCGLRKIVEMLNELMVWTVCWMGYLDVFAIDMLNWEGTGIINGFMFCEGIANQSTQL